MNVQTHYLKAQLVGAGISIPLIRPVVFTGPSSAPSTALHIVYISSLFEVALRYPHNRQP